MSDLPLLEDDLDQPHKPLLRRWFGPMREGSLRAATLVLAVTAIDTGVLALPYVMTQLGWAMGTGLIALAGLLNVASIEILLQAAIRNGSKSYSELIYVTQGPLMARLLDILVVGDCWGAIIAYFVFLGDNMPPLMCDLISASGLPVEGVNKGTVLPVLSVLFFIASMPRRITSLGNCSLLGVISVLYLIALLISHALSESLKVPAGHLLEVPLVPEDSGSLKGIRQFTNSCAIIIFSFLCQSNVFLVYEDLERPTMKRLSKVTRLSTYFQVLSYTITALSSCIAFGTETSDDVFLSFSSKNLVVQVGRALLCCALCVSIPLNIYPARATITDLVAHVLPHDELERKIEEKIPLCTPQPIADLITAAEGTLCEGVEQMNAAYHLQQLHHHGSDEPGLGAAGLLRVRSHSNYGHDVHEGHGHGCGPTSHIHLSKQDEHSHQDASLPANCKDMVVLEIPQQHKEQDSTEALHENPEIGISGWIVHFTTSALIVLISLVLAFVLPSLSKIMGAIGGICGVMLMYVLPGLVLLQTRDLRGPLQTCFILTGFTLAALVGATSVVLPIFDFF